MGVTRVAVPLDRRVLRRAEVLEIVRRGREEHRNGRTRIIRSSAELR
jgi:hypothetical protein